MLSALYNFIFIFFLLFFLVREFSFKYFKLSKNEFLISFFYHLSFTIFFLILFKNQPADYKHYLELKHIKDFSIKHSFASSEMIYNFIHLFKNFLFFNDFSIFFLFSSISYFGILIFIKNLIQIGVDKKTASLIFFIPGIHLWTSLPGKDCFVLFFLSSFFYMYINKKIIISLFFIFLVLLIRPQIGTIFLLSILLTEFILIKGLKKSYIFLFFVIISFFILNSSITSGYLLSKNIFSENLIFQMLGKINELTLKFSNSDTSYEINNVFLNIFNYLVFPTDFILKQNSLIVNSTIFLEILSLIFLLNLLMKHKKNIKIEKKIIFFLFIISMVYLMILPQAIFNFGLNIRQKWMIIPFLIYLSFFLKNLFVKMNRI